MNVPRIFTAQDGLERTDHRSQPRCEEAFRTESKLQPGNAEAAYRLGNALLQQGKVKEARVELKKSDALQPDMPEALYALGKAAASENDSPAAEKAWKRLLEIEKGSGLSAQTHFALAGLYRKQGKMEAAEREMDEFKKLQNTSSPPEGPQP